MYGFEKAQEKYLLSQINLSKLREEIERLERKYEKAKEVQETEGKSLYWATAIMPTLVNHIETATPDIEWTEPSFSPIGLRAEIYMFGTHKSSGKEISLCFTAGDLSKAEICIDTGEVLEDLPYKEGSIGYINRMNNISKPVKTIQDILEVINKQIEE